jgi:hypothetical protein
MYSATGEHDTTSTCHLPAVSAISDFTNSMSRTTSACTYKQRIQVFELTIAAMLYLA